MKFNKLLSIIFIILNLSININSNIFSMYSTRYNFPVDKIRPVRDISTYKNTAWTSCYDLLYFLWLTRKYKSEINANIYTGNGNRYIASYNIDKKAPDPYAIADKEEILRLKAISKHNGLAWDFPYYDLYDICEEACTAGIEEKEVTQGRFTAWETGGKLNTQGRKIMKAFATLKYPFLIKTYRKRDACNLSNSYSSVLVINSEVTWLVAYAFRDDGWVKFFDPSSPGKAILESPLEYLIDITSTMHGITVESEDYNYICSIVGVKPEL